MHLFNIHYAEIALKGKNRGDFENQLMENIRRVLKDEKIEKIKKEEMRILVYLEEGADAESIKEKLKKVFGIFSFSLTYEIERDLDKIKQLVLEKMDDRKGKEILTFPLTLGVVGTVLVPVLAAVGALAALIGECTISVERET